MPGENLNMAGEKESVGSEEIIAEAEFDLDLIDDLED